MVVLGGLVPSLDIADAAQQIDVAGCILFHNVFHVVGFQGLLELSPRYEVLDLISAIRLSGYFI